MDKKALFIGIAVVALAASAVPLIMSSGDKGASQEQAKTKPKVKAKAQKSERQIDIKRKEKRVEQLKKERKRAKKRLDDLTAMTDEKWVAARQERVDKGQRVGKAKTRQEAVENAQRRFSESKHKVERLNSRIKKLKSMSDIEWKVVTEAEASKKRKERQKRLDAKQNNVTESKATESNVIEKEVSSPAN